MRIAKLIIAGIAMALVVVVFMILPAMITLGQPAPAFEDITLNCWLPPDGWRVIAGQGQGTVIMYHAESGVYAHIQRTALTPAPCPG